MLGSLAVTAALPSNTPALARQVIRLRSAGLKTAYRQDWPVATTGEHIICASGSRGVLADRNGHVAVLTPAGKRESRVAALTHLRDQAIIDLAVQGKEGFALTSRQEKDGKSLFYLVGLRLQPVSKLEASQPRPLQQFSDASALAVGARLVCVGGADGSTGLILVYGRQGIDLQPEPLGQVNLHEPLRALALHHDRLLALSQPGGKPSQGQLVYIDLSCPHHPEIRKELSLDGEFRILDMGDGCAFILGHASNPEEIELRSVMLAQHPHLVDHLKLPQLTSTSDIKVQGKEIHLLGAGRDGRLLVDIRYDKALSLTEISCQPIPAAGDFSRTPGKLAVAGRLAFVASGQGGLEILKRSGAGWQPLATFNLPPLTTSGLAVRDRWLVLASMGLELYDISRPSRPQKVAAAQEGSAIRSVALAGRNLICLTRQGLTLSDIGNPATVFARTDCQQQNLLVAASDERVYLLRRDTTATVVIPVAVTGGKLSVLEPVGLKASFTAAAAAGDYLLLGDTGRLSLWHLPGPSKPLAVHRLDNFAVRQIQAEAGRLAVTAVDQSANGYLFLFAWQDEYLEQMSALPLPNTGAAIAVANEKALVVGQAKTGAASVALISLTDLSRPALVSTLPTVDEAACVTIHQELGIVGGRGLQILKLL